MNIGREPLNIAICFGQFGPYHHARVAALQEAPRQGEAGGVEQRVGVIPVQIAAATTTYAWSVEQNRGLARWPLGKARSGEQGTEIGGGGSAIAEGLRTLCAGADEEVSPLQVFFRARRLFKREGVQVVFVPSYSPVRFFALFAAAKSLGIKTVMMNESHAGTERATGWKKWIKRQIVRQFDAALVGGAPQKRHFAALGIPEEKIFTGYDAVDNAYFAARAAEVRSTEEGAWSREQGARDEEQEARLIGGGDAGATPRSTSRHFSVSDFRQAYGLPERYFLSLGRMVPKKNLATLVSAYASYVQGVAVAGEKLNVASHDVEEQPDGPSGAASLVLVGSGEEEAALEAQARALGLEVIDRRTVGTSQTCHLSPSTCHQENRGAVFFYGFRQIEENPVFYALAEAFILPSLYEEWGLVVNEAMACSLPVIVSRTAGCAEDLLPASGQVTSGEAPGGSAAANALSSQPTALNSLEQRSNGFVFDPTSAEALTEAFKRLASSEEERKTMGQASREIIGRWGCDNFARQAWRAAQAAS